MTTTSSPRETLLLSTESAGSYRQEKFGPITGLPEGKSTYIGDIDEDGYLYLYSPSFDPDNPATNLVASNDDYGSGSYSKISGVSLVASTDYIVVATTKNADTEGSSMQLSVEGSSIITAPS